MNTGACTLPTISSNLQTMKTPDDETVEELTQQFAEQASVSKAGARSLKERSSIYKCLECGQIFDRFQDVRQHVKKQKHVVKKDKIKNRILEFIKERLPVSTYEEAKHMYEHGHPRAMTQSERQTFCSYLMNQAFMEQFYSP